MIYSNNNISLQKIDIEDLNILLDLKHESWETTHNIAIINYSNQLEWFKSINNNPNCLFLKAQLNDEFNTNKTIGFFKINTIDWINRCCLIGYDVIKEYRGKGFGNKIAETGIKFCFEILNMNRIETEIITTNIASIKCAEFAGMIKEGEKREVIIKQNKKLNMYLYSIINSDRK